jgi:hypothetical protein
MAIEDKVEPKKTKHGAIKDETIAKALRATYGLQAHAGEMLGVTVQCINKRVKQSPYLQQIIEHCTELGLDEAQKGLRNKILAKDLGAICFLLKTKGRSRGFSENATIVVSPEIAAMFEKQMAQLAEIQKERKTSISNE